MNKYLLSPEEISQVIQCSVAKWAICEPQFIEDIADVISKAQHKKSIGEFIKRIEAESYKYWCEKCGLPEFFNSEQLEQLKKEVLEEPGN